MHNRHEQQPFLRGQQLIWIELINRNRIKILDRVQSSPPFCWLPVELFLHQSACVSIFRLQKLACKLFCAQFKCWMNYQWRPQIKIFLYFVIFHTYTFEYMYFVGKCSFFSSEFAANQMLNGLSRATAIYAVFPPQNLRCKKMISLSH